MWTNLLALKTIKSYLKAVVVVVVHWNGAIVISFFFCLTLLVMMLITCPLVLEAFKFFFPLLLSTGICVTAVYEFILSEENHQGGGQIINFEDGTNEEIRGEARRNQFSFIVDDACVEVSCVPLEDGLDSYNLTVKVLLIEGGKKVERLVQNNTTTTTNNNYGGCEEEHISSQVHNFAEGVWNSYFGRDDFSEVK